MIINLFYKIFQLGLLLCVAIDVRLWKSFVVCSFLIRILWVPMMAEEFKNMESGSRPRNLLLRSTTHSNLMKFKEAKQELQKIFAEIENYVNDCRTFFEEKLPKDAGQRLSPKLGNKSSTELQPCIDKVQHIQEIISRNQMKCAFFGRYFSIISIILRSNI